jgi:hypothetical protein
MSRAKQVHQGVHSVVLTNCLTCFYLQTLMAAAVTNGFQCVEVPTESLLSHAQGRSYLAIELEETTIIFNGQSTVIILAVSHYTPVLPSASPPYCVVCVCSNGGESENYA